MVYNCKSLHGNHENNQFVAESCVWDMERGVLDGIQPLPWQTDTSIGDWYYNENWEYRPTSWTVHMLVDIVSKNGNLLLNVVQRPDGSVDPEVEQQLAELADWMAIHSEAIHGTRPWQVFGEGRVGEHEALELGEGGRVVRAEPVGHVEHRLASGRPNRRRGGSRSDTSR